MEKILCLESKRRLSSKYGVNGYELSLVSCFCIVTADTKSDQLSPFFFESALALAKRFRRNQRAEG